MLASIADVDRGSGFSFRKYTFAVTIDDVARQQAADVQLRTFSKPPAPTISLGPSPC